jgi:hypothetical protein
MAKIDDVRPGTRNRLHISTHILYIAVCVRARACVRYITQSEAVAQSSNKDTAGSDQTI